MAAALKDPLSLAQESLEAYLVASPGVKFAMGLAVKNIDGFTKTRSTKQQDVNSESDLPAIKVIPVGGPTNINFSTCAMSWDFGCNIEVITGDLRFNKNAGPTAWAVYSAMACAIHHGTIIALTLAKCLPDDAPDNLKNCTFIRDIVLPNVAMGLTDTTNPKNPSIAGFSALVDLKLQMVFPRAFVEAWASQDFSF